MNPNDQIQKLDGLTKREYFAAMALQGHLSNSVDTNQGREPLWHLPIEEMVERSIKIADQLLKQLNS
jgi:hypothetical protein